MSPHDVRSAYLKFFTEKPRSHAVIPSASLVPENDPTTLFTSSGMQPLVPYLLGQQHPLGKRLVDSQKTFRSQDIEEVGDNRHTTFFEMLGNWSLGDYFKKEQLTWCFEFFTDILSLDPKKLYITVFRGNEGIGKDTESVEIWKKLFSEKGITAKDVDFSERDGMQDGRIFYYDETKNWWSRSGVPDDMPPGEPGGPDSEVFYDFGDDLKLHENSPFKDRPCHVNCDCGRFLEIGNSVFMQFQKQDDGSFKELPNKNVDFGGGLERIIAAAESTLDIFKTSTFSQLIQAIEQMSGVLYAKEENQAPMRVIADHVRASVFLIADGVLPSNKEQGYVLRRLLRRAAVKMRHLSGDSVTTLDFSDVVRAVTAQYGDVYFPKQSEAEKIPGIIRQEMEKFGKAMDKGLRVLEKTERVDGKVAFDLYQTYGFPLEVTVELVRQKGQHVDTAQFREEFVKHQELSRTSSKGMFKGGLADHSKTTTKYHTATHLLHAALRKVLGSHVMQQGSNITAERLRFDYSHPLALTPEEKKAVEDLVNEKIMEDLPVTVQTMDKQKALDGGAIAFFKEKYPDMVTVYTIGNNPEKDWFSKELCGGPHVSKTGEIGKIAITKEESIGSGKRRIYVTLTS